MKNAITYAQALEMAIKICSVPANSDEYSEVVEKLTALKEKYSKPHKTSDDAKARAKAKRANDRAVVVAQIAPILREGLSHTPQGITAKELFSLVKGKLPEDYTAAKVRAMLLREMRDELIITKGKANTYALKSEVNQ